MAFKKFVIDEQLEVSIYKRRGTKNMRLSVTADNKVRVSIPFWLTYQAGLKFAESRRSWINEQLHPVSELKNGLQVGKYHRLVFIPGSEAIRTRLTATEINVHYPPSVPLSDSGLQEAARKACLRALKAEASKLLPPRLKDLAGANGFSYNDVSIKRMKSRWGSCDSNKNIVLNQYLMQLPWQLIDYVLLHELNHTNHMHHSSEFWDAMEEILPDVKQLRKQIKSHRPVLSTNS